jgi:hypothetical protein
MREVVGWNRGQSICIMTEMSRYPQSLQIDEVMVSRLSHYSLLPDILPFNAVQSVQPERNWKNIL